MSNLYLQDRTSKSACSKHFFFLVVFLFLCESLPHGVRITNGYVFPYAESLSLWGSMAMSGKAKLAGALGVAELLGTDLRQPLPVSPKKERSDGPAHGGYPKAAEKPKASAVDGHEKRELKVNNPPSAPSKAACKQSASGYEKTLDLPVVSEVEVNKGKGSKGGKGDGKTLDLSTPGGYSQSSPKTDISPNAQCTISEGHGPSEIRTKVFRIGAPLLRSTIPVTLGGKKDAKPISKVEGDDEKDGSDVETILSLSDGEREDEGQLSVTLDFPC